MLVQSQRFEYMLPEEDGIAELILQALMYERRATDELVYACMGVVEDAMGSDCVEDYLKLSKLIHQLGIAVFEKLQMLRAYQNGYLFYQFHNWYGKDMVLQRLTMDHINSIL